MQLRFYPHHSDIKWHSLLAFRPLTHHFLLDKAIPRRITRDANDSAWLIRLTSQKDGTICLCFRHFSLNLLGYGYQGYYISAVQAW
jgi:hypothetical protein